MDHDEPRTRGVVDVPGRVVVKDTKTLAPRVVAVDAGTLERLTAHQAWTAERAKTCGTSLAMDAYVLSHEVDGSMPIHPDHATDAFASIRGGHDIRTVSGRLGHAKTSTTLDIYSAFLEPNDREAADALGSLLSDEAAGG